MLTCHILRVGKFDEGVQAHHAHYQNTAFDQLRFHYTWERLNIHGTNQKHGHDGRFLLPVHLQPGNLPQREGHDQYIEEDIYGCIRPRLHMDVIA